MCWLHTGKMAQQAILAAKRRKIGAAGVLGGVSFGISRRDGKNIQQKVQLLMAVLYEERHRLSELFGLWDDDGDGLLSEKEFKRGVRMLVGRNPSHQEWKHLMACFDGNSSGGFEFHEFQKMITSSVEAEKAEAEEKLRHQPPAVRALRAAYAFINTTTVQTLMYFAIVIIFQLLTESLRLREEYYLDKAVNDQLLKNAFDQDLNRFGDIRRVADVYEWGNHVLWPGLLGNMPSNCGDIGLPGRFRSAEGWAAEPTNLSHHICITDTLPNGEGKFNDGGGASPPLLSEVVDRMNQLDWTDGLSIFQARVQRTTAEACVSEVIGGANCLPELRPPFQLADTAAFGRNWSDESAGMAHPFKWWTAAELGANPQGGASAHPASYWPYPADGFVSLVMPFFSDTWIGEERGTAANITDFRLTRCVRGNNRVPRFFCVRLSINGEWIHQLCDPNQAGGRTTGVVRAAIEEFWNDLRRAHYIDAATRMVVMTLPLTSNSVGVRSRVKFIFEFVSTGSVLPSYDSEPQVVLTAKIQDTKLYVMVALYVTIFFCVLEICEILGLEDGVFDLSDLATYCSNVWNLMDWLNYSIFFIVWWKLSAYVHLVGSPKCALLCQTIGYHDDWEVMETVRAGKFYLSLCVCIQLLKIIKFMSALIPKMGLAPSVLKKAFADLVFFGIVFAISMLAFSTMFYIQLGPVMAEFAGQGVAFITLGRALFGDFDIEDVLANSNSFINTMLYVTYLFIAVFIMLSMFFAILGESQANLRDDQQRTRKQQDVPIPEYGIITEAGRWLYKGLQALPVIGPELQRQREGIERAADTAAKLPPRPTPADRIEVRQLEMGERLDEVIQILQQQQRQEQEPQQAENQQNASSPFLTASSFVPTALDQIAMRLEAMDLKMHEMSAHNQKRKKRRAAASDGAQYSVQHPGKEQGRPSSRPASRPTSPLRIDADPSALALQA